MDILYAFVLLFFTAMIPFVEAQFAAPIAVLLGLPVVPVIVIAFLGNFLSLLVVIWIVFGIREALARRRGKKLEADTDNEGSFMSKRKRRAKKIWDKYGMPGLAIIGMFFVGGHLTALLACSFTGNRLRVTVWMAISILLWGGGLGIAAHFGYDFLSDHPWTGILEQNLSD